jgi:hypothetical protein
MKNIIKIEQDKISEIIPREKITKIKSVKVKEIKNRISSPLKASNK